MECGGIQLGIACSLYTIHKYMTKKRTSTRPSRGTENLSAHLKKAATKTRYSDAKIHAMGIDEVRCTIQIHNRGGSRGGGGGGTGGTCPPPPPSVHLIIYSCYVIVPCNC